MKTFFTLSVCLLFVQMYAQSDSLVVMADDSIYTAVEVMPVYPGGEKEMLYYMARIPYPPQAKEKDEEGSVFIKLVVNKEAEVTNVTVAKSSGSANLDSAAVAHIRKMPKWQSPGYQSGKAVNVQYILPFKFNLVSGLGIMDRDKEKKKKD